MLQKYDIFGFILLKGLLLYNIEHRIFSRRRPRCVSYGSNTLPSTYLDR